MTRPSDRAIAKAWNEAVSRLPSGGLVHRDRFDINVGLIESRARELDATAAPVVVGEDMESFRRLIQKAADNIQVPKMTPARAEYWKAGARAAITSFNKALSAALAGD